MKTKNKIRILIISVVAVIAIALFFLFITANGYSPYSEGLHLSYLSDNEFQKLLEKDCMQGVDVVTITDKDLEPVPKIRELIDMAVTEKFPLNESGHLVSTVETLMEYHRYYANILAEKYSKDPDDFFRTSSVSAHTLEKYPDAYRYEFDGAYYEYKGVQYFWNHADMPIYEEGQLADIDTIAIRNPLDPNRHIWATITDEDLEKMPLLKEAIDSIGTLQENVTVQNAMSSIELDMYQRWQQANIPSGVFEYDGKYFRLGTWIA